MTLRERNRLINVFFAFSVAVIGFFAILGAVCLFRGTASVPLLSGEAVLSAGSVSRLWFAAPYNFFAVLASVIFLTLCVPAVTFLMALHFEKTQAQECTYFTLFLFACLTEAPRLFLPLLNLWQSNSAFLVTWTRVLAFGRLLAPAAFLFSAVFSIDGQNRDSERNALMLMAAAGIIATLIPVNTAYILPTCTVTIAFARFFRVYQFCLYAFTLVALLVQTRGTGKEHRFMLLGFAILFAGYLLLTNAASWLEFILGAPAFSIGIYLYLMNLHKTYI